MRTAMIHDADPPGAIAEGDQLLTEQLHPHRRAVAFQL